MCEAWILGGAWILKGRNTERRLYYEKGLNIEGGWIMRGPGFRGGRGY